MAYIIRDDDSPAGTGQAPRKTKGGRMAQKMTCPGCGGRNPRIASKAVVPALAKAPQPPRPRCIHGCGRGQPGALFCAECGAAYEPRAALRLVKSAGAQPQLSHWERMIYDPDPALRDVAWRQLHPDLYPDQPRKGA